MAKSIIQKQRQAIVTLTVDKWDTSRKLPKKVKVQVGYDYTYSFDQIHDIANDEAADAVGYCIKRSTMHSIELL